MNDTRNEIIRIGNELVRSVGYNAFSYADIAKALNIKNAAIHYYFPSKSDLGVEIIERKLLIHRRTYPTYGFPMLRGHKNYSRDPVS